jgi:predicted dehydrogenase
VALLGAGHWGSRLARNLAAAGADLRWVCDVEAARAFAVADRNGARATIALDEALDDPGVAAVAVATPAMTHAEIVRRALEAARHVLVEKPLAGSVGEAVALATLARERGLVVMCDHTYRFAPAVGVIRELIASGELGAIRAVDATRTNRNHAQPDIDVFWDLAHHDLSIVTSVLPASACPTTITARTADRARDGRACAGDVVVELADGGTARFHLDWHASDKVRRMTFTGDDGVLAWTDSPSAGLELRSRGSTRAVPVPDHREPLALVVEEFLAAVGELRDPSCGPSEEILVLRLLEAVTRSADADGEAVAVVGGLTTRRA